LGIALLAIALSSTAAIGAAAELVVNGSFESNGGVGSSTFSGWTLVNQAGGSGSFYAQSGTVPPPTGVPVTVPTPPAGTFAAMSSQFGPGSHVLYQDVAIPAGATATLRVQVYVNNPVGTFATPASLDYSVIPNQQARIDIMDPVAAVTDMGAGILLNVYRTAVGDPAVSGYTAVVAGLSAFAGRTIRLRIAEVDNQGVFYLGVDAVSIDATTLAPTEVPTLSDAALVALALLMVVLGIGAMRRRGTLG
jgi:hypothetical protein